MWEELTFPDGVWLKADVRRSAGRWVESWFCPPVSYVPAGLNSTWHPDLRSQKWQQIRLEQAGWIADLAPLLTCTYSSEPTKPNKVYNSREGAPALLTYLQLNTAGRLSSSVAASGRLSFVRSFVRVRSHFTFTSSHHNPNPNHNNTGIRTGKWFLSWNSG